MKRTNIVHMPIHIPQSLIITTDTILTRKNLFNHISYIIYRMLSRAFIQRGLQYYFRVCSTLV